jgi:solute carrier family 25 (mitochondrial phosphate transporter), member 23/24/25/41
MEIIKEGGVPGLFRGLGAASVRVLPMAVVSFGTYEFVRLQYMQLEGHLQLMQVQREQRLLPTSKLECVV